MHPSMTVSRILSNDSMRSRMRPVVCSLLRAKVVKREDGTKVTVFQPNPPLLADDKAEQWSQIRRTRREVRTWVN